MHAKNSWFPSVPLIADGTIPLTTSPRSVTNATILSCAFSCKGGSRTIPPFPTSERCSSNCGLISARITPVEVKMVEGSFQLQCAPADVFSCGFECDGRLFVEKLRWLRRNPSADSYNAGHYCSPRLFAAWEQSLSNEKLIKP